jgi:hypothetical protein
MPGAQPMAPATGLRPPVQVSGPHAMQSNQQKPGAPSLEDSFLNQNDTGGQNPANSNPQEATTSGKKVSSLSFWFTYHNINCTVNKFLVKDYSYLI